MKYIVHIARFIVGVLFVFSGIVKTIDPIGTAYKLEEYFSPDVLNIPYFQEHALFLAVVFVVLEVMLGIWLLLGIRKKIVLPLLLALILFFTFLTYYSAKHNVVQDCGCFGDFLKLEPWTSFFKDLVLLVLIVIVFIGHKFVKPLFSWKINLGIWVIGFLITAYVAWHGLNHLPLVDFRPFAVGENIKENMKDIRPEEKITYYTFNHAKTGEVKTMDDSTFMASNIWEDTLWVMDENATKDSVIVERIPAKIDALLISLNDIDVTEDLLDEEKLVFVVFPSGYLDACSEGFSTSIQLAKELQENNIKVLALDIQENDLSKYGLQCAALDDKKMKAMIRSNPGIVVLSKGVVLAKYHHHDIPTAEEISKLFQ